MHHSRHRQQESESGQGRGARAQGSRRRSPAGYRDFEEQFARGEEEGAWGGGRGDTEEGYGPASEREQHFARQFDRPGEVDAGWDERREHLQGRREFPRRRQEQPDEYGYERPRFRERGFGEGPSDLGRAYGEAGFSGQRGGYGERSESRFDETDRGGRFDYGSSFAQEQRRGGGGAAERESHAGKGPKGYRRADDRVLDDVCLTLERHPRIDASEIQVECSNGEVILRGTVDSRQTRRLAEESIEDLPGVRDVRNELRAQPRAEQERSGSASELQSGGKGSSHTVAT